MKISSEKELNKQESEIKKKLFLVFISIAIMLIIITYYQSNSLNINKVKYEKSRNLEFSGKVIKKKQEGDYPRAARHILLDNYHKERVSNYIYGKISIGDSVFKRTGSDSIHFILNNGEIIIEDYNKFLRDNYYELLNKKNVGK
jgi:hypothetical protein